MKHLILISHAESYRSMSLPPALEEAMGKFIGDALASGTLVETAGLGGMSDATRVRLDGGKVTITDGPFTEAKEMIGGYAMLDVASKEEAVAFAKEFMDMHRINWPAFNGTCEVRPLEGV